MEREYEMFTIGWIENDFTGKFGIPRQSSLAESMLSTIRFYAPYDTKAAFRGLEDFSHLWLLWIFSENTDFPYTPTVRPPMLGGNERKGVFATRSPFRPNPIGLSCVKLEEIVYSDEGKVSLVISGADLKSGTPILDIKPYIPYADARPHASQGFAPDPEERKLLVESETDFPSDMTDLQRKALFEVLSADPRPAYQNDPERTYGMYYGKWNVRFRVEDPHIIILAIEEAKPREN